MERPNAQGDYDPLVGIDHSGICEDFFLSTKGQIRQVIREEYDRQVELGRPVFNSFQAAVNLIRDAGVEGNHFNDEMSQATLESGILLGLRLLEHTADSLGVNSEDYFKQWAESGLTAIVIDTEHEKYKDQTSTQKAYLVSNGVKLLGLRHLDLLPDAYMEFIKKAEACFPDIEAYSEAFRVGFGYVMGSGYIAMQYSFEREGIGEVDFDLALSADSEIVTPTHQSMANKFVRLIESDSEGSDLESIFGNVMQDNTDSHGQLFEVLHSLSLALYRNEGELGLNDTAEAFFIGANLGAHIATDIGESQLGEPAFIKRWLQTRLNRELSKYGPDYYEHTRVDAKKAFEKLRSASRIPQEYTNLLKLIDEEQEYDEAEGTAFREGFHYALISLLDQVESQRKGDARKTARDEIKSFDEEFDLLMHEYDLTGNLEMVFSAYLEHCKAFDLNPNDLTEDEADTILELTLTDYDKLMPEISEVEIHGPCFLQFLDDETDNDSTPALLEKGGKIKAEIAGFRLSVAPTDQTYSSSGATEIGQFAFRYMPSYVFKNACFTLSDGSEHTEESRIMIGFVVPGTTFRRIDF